MLAVARGKRGRRKGKPVAAPTARPFTITAQVASPYTPGTTDRVERVLDSVLQLRRARQITEEQYQAALAYQAAYEEIRRGLGNAMDPDRISGASAGGATVSMYRMVAVDYLKAANAALDAVGARVIVEMVVGEGFTIRQVATSLWAPEGREGPSQRQRDAISLMLRAGLERLASLRTHSRRN